MNIIEVRGLSKSFGDCDAVDRINFDVRKGEIYGFLGPNGAGKTTTINMLTGLTRPSGGNFTIHGIDGIRNIKKAQAVIGIVPDESNLYDELSGFDNLTFCASLYGIGRVKRERRAKELLGEFGLLDVAGRLFRQYSKGMKRKLTIAAGIIHEPEILFLDEPTTGIDIESARHIRGLIKQMNRDGTTIFLTTHYIEEAERLCDRICFIVQGRIVRTGTLDELMTAIQGDNVMQFNTDKDINPVKRPFSEVFSRYRIEYIDSRSINIHSKDMIELLPFIRFFEENGIAVLEARIIKPSLLDVFVSVTGIGLDKMKREKEGRKGR